MNVISEEINQIEEEIKEESKRVSGYTDSHNSQIHQSMGSAFSLKYGQSLSIDSSNVFSQSSHASSLKDIKRQPTLKVKKQN